MAQHGYLREYDEGWDRGDDRNRDDERSWRDEDRERGWRAGEWRDRNRSFDDEARRSNERTRNFMLGERDLSSGRGDRGRSEDHSRDLGERARSSLREEDRWSRSAHQDEWSTRDRGSSGYGREHGYGGFQGDYSRSQNNQGGFGGRADWERSPRSFSSHQDDHYRSWRDRQMRALDRDYEDYCREREQQFHADFDTWRRNRQDRGASGDRQKQGKSASEEVMELDNPAQLSNEPQSGPSPMAEATLGTNNSENTIPGGRR